MLTELYIRNYLFVAECRIGFAKGMTVITGETGAGKSILVGSIALIFADKSEPEALDKSLPIYLEASFDPQHNQELLAFLNHEGYEAPEELILAREISTAGKSRYFLNGRKVSVSLMKDLKPLMIDFHHQRDQQKLLNPAYQLELLDSFGGLTSLRETFSGHYLTLRQNLRLLAELEQIEADNLRTRELYQYQFDEIDKARLQTGEDAKLQQEFELLTHAQEIAEAAGTGYYELTEADGSIYDKIRAIVNTLDRFSSFNTSLGNTMKTLKDSLELIRDSASELSDLSESVSADPARLESIQSRLDVINALIFKHKVKSIAQLLELFEERQRQLDAMDDNSQKILELKQHIDQAYTELLKQGEELSAKRRKAAQLLKQELTREVRELAIPKAILEITIDKKASEEKSMLKFLYELDETGFDTMSMLFSANPGFTAKTLSAVASGGELSRVLLALKKVLAQKLPARLVILDEIDSGIGGKTAEQVAIFIRQLSLKHRVMCITHLAQIAAIADQHIAIGKTTSTNQTKIEINELDTQPRLEEIARMLSGDVTELSLSHAQELINRYKEEVHE